MTKFRFTIGGLVSVFVLLSFASFAFALEPSDKWEGKIDYAGTGGTLLADTCTPQYSDPLDPNSEIICAGGPDGQGDSTITESKAFLAGIPEGTHVVKAYLIWMGSLKHNVIYPDNLVKLTPPNGKEYSIQGTSENLKEVTFAGSDPNGVAATYHYYTYREDITDIIRAHNITEGKPIVGEYKFSGFDGYAGIPYPLNTLALGGWSLFIVYSHPNAEPRRIYYYTDFQRIQDDVVVLTPSGFKVPEEPEAKITFFLGEGDLNVYGVCMNALNCPYTHDETLSFNGTVLTDACNSANNAYNSTVNTNIHASEQPCRNNQFSIDLDTFPVSQYLSFGDTEATVELSLGQDMVFTNYLILSIKTKMPDFDIPGEPEKDADIPSGGSLFAGQEFKYLIYVENNGEDVATNVRVKDKLPLEVVYIKNSTVVIEPDGTRRAVADSSNGLPPTLTGLDIAESMPPGRAYRRTVEMTVRLKTFEEGVTKETIIQNTAEIISGDGNVYFTNGGVPVTHKVTAQSFEGELHFLEGKKHPYSRFVQPGQSDVVIAHIMLKALEGDVSISGFTFTPVEDTEPLVISQAQLIWDKDGNGLVDDSDVALGEKHAWGIGGMAFGEFSGLGDVKVNATESLILVADISSEIAAGTNCQLELVAENVSIRGKKKGLPFTTGILYLPSDETDLSVELGEGNIGGGFITRGQSSSVMQIKLSAYSAGVQVTAITFGTEGTAYDPNDILSVGLYRDTNANGTNDFGEQQLGQKTILEEDGAVLFDGFAIDIAEGTSSYLLVMVTVAENAPLDNTFKMTINSNSQVVAGISDVEGSPIEGGLFVFADNVTECTTDEECINALGASWSCDQLAGICRFSGSNSPDGDDDSTQADGDVIADGDSGQNVVDDDDGGGGGCFVVDKTSGFLSLLFILIAGILVRRRRVYNS